MSTEPDEDSPKLARNRLGHRREDLLEELRQRDQLWRSKFEETLSSLDGSMVEQVIVKAGVRDYFEKLKERDRLNMETIQQLKGELDSKRRQVDRLQSRLEESETQCIKYYQALMESQARREQLETEKRAKEEQELEQERERLLQVSQSMNNLSSYASSMIADCDIPPPPPISVEEILGMTAPNNLPDLPTMRSPFYSARTGADFGGQTLSKAGSIGGASQKSKLSRSGSMRYPLSTTNTTTTSHQLTHNRSTIHSNSMRQY